MSDFSLSILIIRHAEKAGHKWPGPGLTPEGTEDEQSLVVRGWQRAGAWAALFAGEIRGADYPRPSMIYAADPAATTGDEPSQRPFQTVIPVAERLNLRIVTDYAVGQELEGPILSQRRRTQRGQRFVLQSQMAAQTIAGAPDP